MPLPEKVIETSYCTHLFQGNALQTLFGAGSGATPRTLLTEARARRLARLLARLPRVRARRRRGPSLWIYIDTSMQLMIAHFCSDSSSSQGLFLSGVLIYLFTGRIM